MIMTGNELHHRRTAAGLSGRMLGARLDVSGALVLKQEALGDQPLNSPSLRMKLEDVLDAFAPYDPARDGSPCRALPRRPTEADNGAPPRMVGITREQGERIIVLLEQLLAAWSDQ